MNGSSILRLLIYYKVCSSYKPWKSFIILSFSHKFSYFGVHSFLFMANAVIYCLRTIFIYYRWTWGWMEPPLGTISFVLLALQFARAQLLNMGVTPYTSFIRKWRGKRLAANFPQYNANVIINFSKSSALYATSQNL
jgi:hypothetical protein